MLVCLVERATQGSQIVLNFDIEQEFQGYLIATCQYSMSLDMILNVAGERGLSKEPQEMRVVSCCVNFLDVP